MKFFITGGAGFIGSHIVDVLISENQSVTVYDNLTSGKIEFIKHHFDNKRFKFIKGDLLDIDLIKQEIVGSDVVIHFAANPDARLGNENTSLDLNQETIVTYNVLEAMRVNNIKKIIFSSSGTIYGETPIIPLNENYGPILPISLYGAGKLASEGLISAFCNTFGMQAWIFRFANVVGGRATHGVIFDFINKLMKNPNELEILGDGHQEKPYIFVDNCIEAILFCFKRSNEIVNLFNIGTHNSTDVNTIAKIIIEEMGLNDVVLKYTGGDRGWPGDIPQVRFDISKLESYGWKPKPDSYFSDQAVRRAVETILEEKGYKCKQ